jgi:alpha-glucosidase
MSLSKDKNWWRQAAIYQIYPRSFADTDDNGIGDLKGVTSKVDYLASLSLDAVWLSPFYPSALADGGYDVDDYRNVDPKLGTLEDFDEMLEALHGAGIRVFVDIVPNHSSNLHQWFKDAIASAPNSKDRARYIFRDGRGAKGEIPPTDWPSHFAPSAWTHESAWGGKHNQWYMHWFAPEQPDWNWDNPEVEADFLTTLKFWADRGVDGFRIDVAHALKKDLSEPLRMRSTMEYDAPQNLDGTGILMDRNEVLEVYRTWRTLFNSYDPPRVAVAEANVHPSRMPLYASEDTLGQSFDFRFIDAAFTARNYKDCVSQSLELAKKNKSSTTWTLGNHDQMRYATKLGLHPIVDRNDWLLSHGQSHSVDFEIGTRCSVAGNLFILALPGCTYIYQGDELGIHEVADIPFNQVQDPVYLRNLKQAKGRDGARVPLPWTRGGTNFGFGGGTPHLPQPDWFADFSVEAESSHSGSPLEVFRAALKLRRELQCAEEITWHETTSEDVLHFSRPNGWNCITNFKASKYPMPVGEIILASSPLIDGKIAAGTTIWFKA